ncbi:DUF1761 domain-containing protein [Rheinheimera sp.]|uniref:DUF1761 domain-containing protein n=1 Tax=Rheinheimera sp. TaxID=1869214 RepID=UPI00307CD6AE
MPIWVIVLAAVSSFMLGGLWYSPLLFGKVWNDENGGVPQTGHPARVFGVSFLFSLLAATCFAHLVGPAPALHHALHMGLLVGLGLVGASFGINYQFAQRSVKLWLIDGGYHTVQFVVFALVFWLCS